MATTRIMPLHVGKGRTESSAISDIIDYVANPQKTDGGKLITGFACDSRVARRPSSMLAKRQYTGKPDTPRNSAKNTRRKSCSIRRPKKHLTS